MRQQEHLRNSRNILDSIKYFSNPKNFFLLLCLFLYIYLIYFDFYVFVFLAEKFNQFKIQNVIFVIIFSSLFGILIFTIFLVNVPRRIMNFTTSGAIFGISLFMLIVSLTLDKSSVDIMGIISICNFTWFFVTSSLPKSIQRFRVFILLPLQRGNF